MSVLVPPPDFGHGTPLRPFPFRVSRPHIFLILFFLAVDSRIERLGAAVKRQCGHSKRVRLPVCTSALPE